MKQKQIQNQTDFASGSVRQHILAQAIPLCFAQLIQLLYNIVDRIYIGHLPGASSLALTGLGLIFPIVTFVAAFISLFGHGGVPLCSIERGRGDIAKAEKIMGNTLFGLIVSSAAIMVLCYVFRRPVLYLFGASDATWKYANEYLRIYLAGTVFVVVGSGMNGFLQSQGFPREAMVTTVSGAVINIILDPIFIFVLNLGVAGAAIATVIAQAVSFVWVMKKLTEPGKVLKLRRENLRPDPALMKRILSLGMSGFVMQATNCGVQVVCNMTLKIFGGDLYIGIMTIVNSVREITSLPIMGLTEGSKPVLGFNYGAARYKRVWEGIWVTFGMGLLYSFLAWALIMLFPGGFIRMFNAEADLLEKGIPAMHQYFSAFIFMTFQFSGQSTFVGLGKAKTAVFFSLLRKAFIVIPLTILLPRLGGLGVAGVFLAEPISNVVGGLACFITMLLTVGKELREKSALEKPL